MYIDKIRVGNNAPEDVNVVIEIPMDHQYIKYEIDKHSGAIVVDRFLKISMFYPCNYGFIPHTLSGDGDPLDALVITSHALLPGTVINVRAIGVFTMEDEAGQDEKIIAIPTHKVDDSYDNIKDIDDLNFGIKKRIYHFFKHYKDLDSQKWVKVQEFSNKNKAITIISEAITRAKLK